MNYLMVAQDVAKWSLCLRRKVGAVLVCKSGGVYWDCNGHSDCATKGCLRAGESSGEHLDWCRGVHAEVGVILVAGLMSCKEGSLYVTHFPCSSCAKIIAHVGIKEVTFSEFYGNYRLSTKILEESNIKINRGVY